MVSWGSVIVSRGSVMVSRGRVMVTWGGVMESTGSVMVRRRGWKRYGQQGTTIFSVRQPIKGLPNN